MQTTSHKPSDITFFKAFFARKTARVAIRISLIVGTILTTINQGDVIMSGNWPPLWKLLLTYMVPYCVSSYSAAKVAVENAKEQVKAA